MAHCEYTSPLGVLMLVASDKGLTGVWWPDDARMANLGDADPDHPVLQQAARELDEYFAGERTQFDVPLDPWTRAVTEALTQQPAAPVPAATRMPAPRSRPEPSSSTRPSSKWADEDRLSSTNTSAKSAPVLKATPRVRATTS